MTEGSDDEGWWLREVLTKGSGCRSQCDACMIGVTFCCHVRREMRVCHVMPQNAVSWLHECCMGVCFGEVAGARNRVFFLCRGASAGAEKYLVCAAGAAALGFIVESVLPWRPCNVWLFMCAYFYALVASVVADRNVMIASRLLGAAAARVILLAFAAHIVNRIGMAASRLR